ncbi:MAG: bile acid:sodium symporter family protein [Verrucomicrobia bacterium]|jgi:bile acid:Na+ symporter, BASS family|nr:bile acid:sodium symporter family protein [Verrucomicrobiota bacterium]
MKTLLTLYTKYFALWVVLGGILAYCFPAPFLAMKPFNKAFFGLTMFGIGAVLRPEDFSRITRQPLIVLIGAIAQFTIMPLGAFLIARLFRLPPEMAVGLILAGCVPGAMASNVMSYIARADAAYSVSLTTVSTMLCPLLTPLLAQLLAGTVLHVPFWPMMIDVLRMVAGPLAIGLLFRRLLRERIEPVVEIFPAISVTFIVFICALVIAGNRSFFSALSPELLLVIAAVFALNLYGMLAGYGVGKLARFELRRRRTLSIEIGMQNAGMGTVLALAHFGERAALSTAVFVYVCIVTASVVAEFWRRVDAR